MKYLESHPMIMIVTGIFGISLSSIFVKFSPAPSAVTAAWRLLWTVVLMTPAVWGSAPRPAGTAGCAPENGAAQHPQRFVPGAALRHLV